MRYRILNNPGPDIVKDLKKGIPCVDERSIFFENKMKLILKSDLMNVIRVLMNDPGPDILKN